MRFIDKIKLSIPEDASVLCALSGGADSVAMTAALCELRDEARRSMTLAAAHYHHGLRAREADRDLLFCGELCKRLGIPFYSERGSIGKSDPRGIEAAGRRERYAFLERTARENGLTHIATGHTADDNAETMLLNLVRGAGMDGLSGIPPVRGNIFRPLLGCTHREAQDYLAQKGISHREDASNHTDEYRRNRIRRHVMPLLKSENPDLAETMGRASRLLRRDADYLNGLAGEALARLLEEPPAAARASRVDRAAIELLRPDGEVPVEVKAASLAELPPSLSGRVVRMLINRASGIHGADIALSHIEAVLELCAAGGQTAASGSVSLPHDLTVLRRYDMLCICPAGLEAANRRSREGFEPVTLTYGGQAALRGLGLRVTWQKKAENIHNLVYSFVLTSDTINSDLQIRPRMPGDRFSSKAGSKSLQDLFVDAKLPRELRNRVPVVADSQGVAGVYGFGASEREGGNRTVICFFIDSMKQGKDV